MGSNPVARIEETLYIKGLFSFEAVKNHKIRRALQGLQENCKRFYFDTCNLDKSVLEFNSISLL